VGEGCSNGWVGQGCSNATSYTQATNPKHQHTHAHTSLVSKGRASCSASRPSPTVRFVASMTAGDAANTTRAPGASGAAPPAASGAAGAVWLALEGRTTAVNGTQDLCGGCGGWLGGSIDRSSSQQQQRKGGGLFVVAVG